MFLFAHPGVPMIAMYITMDTASWGKPLKDHTCNSQLKPSSESKFPPRENEPTLPCRPGGNEIWLGAFTFVFHYNPPEKLSCG